LLREARGVFAMSFDTATAATEQKRAMFALLPGSARAIGCIDRRHRLRG
jgi:hypothetical protein